MSKPAPSDPQLVLLPEGPVELSYEPALPISTLHWSGDLDASRSLIESVKRLGVLEPIIVRADDARVIDGSRRIKAALLNEHTTIPALVARGLEGQSLAPASLLLILNEQRRPNPLAELSAIEELLHAGASEREIVQATGLSSATIRQRLRLQSADPRLRQLAAAGEITLSVLEQAAKLPSNAQAALVNAHDAGEKLTGQTVREIQQVRRVDALSDLPAALFELPAFDAPPVLDEDAIRADERERIAAYIEQKHRRNPPMKLVASAIRAGEYLLVETAS